MQDLAERPYLAAKSSGETRLATPVLYQVSIEAGEAAAEQIARALEETFDPSPVAVGAFELGKGRFEVCPFRRGSAPRCAARADRARRKWRPARAFAHRASLRRRLGDAVAG